MLTSKRMMCLTPVLTCGVAGLDEEPGPGPGMTEMIEESKTSIIVSVGPAG